MHETGHAKLVHWDNPERGDGEGGEFRMGHYFAYKGPSSQGYGFSSGHVLDARVGL